MPDDSTPRIILNPLPSTPPIQPVQPTVPLQPVPKVSTMPGPMPAPAATDQQQRRDQVRTELEKLQQEESSLLNNMKDWLAKVQGSETKQQALERELFELDRTLAAAPSALAVKADVQKQLQQTETKLKQIVNQQKIDEKKAFDNYSAGGLDRQGLLEEMERVRQRYVDAQNATQKTIQELKGELSALDQPINPLPQGPTEIVTPQTTAPVSTSTLSGLITKLAALPEMQSGVGRQLFIDLPNQGTLPMIERSAEGNGIIVSAGGTTGFVADADLLRAGATAEDIISLSISQVSATSVAPVGGASGNS